MGSENGSSDEHPVHTIYLDDYWIYQTEVTNRMYALCVEAKICESPESSEYGNDDSADHPVVTVSWYDAQTYCEWVGGRLPTEAEWEKAARGGLENMSYPWGNEAPVCDLGAENGAQFNDCNGESVPVGSFAPNGYGLYDMAGNVWEWVADWYVSDYYQNSPLENPIGPEYGDFRVLRGGSSSYNYSSLRVAYRRNSSPAIAFYLSGFRCALSPQP
jgi:formylglycine-generating enzyme required for sulfatase activity